MNRTLSRRSVLKRTAGAVGLASAGGLLASCDALGASSARSAGVLRIGFVSPTSGDATSYGTANPYLLRKVRGALRQGLTSGGKTYDVEIVDRDSQSDPAYAARTAAELIRNDRVDMMLCTSAPETVNPVSDACEKAGIPCLSTITAWEAWYFGRGASADKPFKYTYHFFVGTDEVATACTSLWRNGGVRTNELLGVMWPDDSDGDAARQSLGPRLRKAGFAIEDPGAYRDGTTDYSAQLRKLRKAEVDIFNGFPLPSDFTVFWQQARESNFRPKIATLAKACQVPAQVEPLGAGGLGITAGFWWTPEFPYSSSLTGQTSRQLADEYTSQTGNQWTQTLGSNMALFEVAVHALKSVSDPKDRKALAAQIGATSITTVVGPLDWTSGPVRNVSTEPLVMGQWRQAPLGSGFLVEPVIVDNGAFHAIPVGGSLQALI